MRRPPARVFIGTPAGSGATGSCAVHVSPRYILLICWRYYFRGTGHELTATRAGTGIGVRCPHRIVCSRFSCASHIDQYWRVPGFKILPYMYGFYVGQGPTWSMRKMTVEVCPKDPLMGMPPDAEDLNLTVKTFLDRVEFVNILELLKMNFERGEETVIAEITMKEGYTADDLEFPEILGSLEVLRAEGRTYTCFLRYVIRDEFLLEKMREFDLDVIWASPMYKSRDQFVYACIGDAENLNKILRLMSTYGEVRNVIFEEATFSGNDPLSRLTPRQKDLLIAAKQYGYYEYPRKINSQQLAEKVGISKATAIEHLRKAEARLISTLLAGY